MMFGKTASSVRQRIEMRIVGLFGLLVAVLFWGLYFMNLRSRMYYHGPDWSFLGWIAAYFTVTGIGLLLLQKWAVLLGFLPPLAILLTYVVSWYKRGF
ncbi:MAG: hypothetical protein WA213_19385 [Terriglobales bacterium]